MLTYELIERIVGDEKQSNQCHSLHQQDIMDPKLRIDVTEILKKLAQQPNLSQAEQALLGNMTDTSLMLPPIPSKSSKYTNCLYSNNGQDSATATLPNYIYNVSPLHVAVYEAVTSNVKALINNGETLNIRDDAGNTPLMYAILSEEPNAEIIKLLITSPNINLDIKNNDAQSALHIATKYNCINIVKLLLDAGANINAVNDEGDTALHLALQYHYMDIAKLLISNSEVDIQVPNDLTLTPLQLATVIALVVNDQELEKLIHSKARMNGHQLDVSNNKVWSNLEVETDDFNNSTHDPNLAVQGQDNIFADEIYAWSKKNGDIIKYSPARDVNEELEIMKEQGYSFAKQKTALKRSITDKWDEIDIDHGVYEESL